MGDMADVPNPLALAASGDPKEIIKTIDVGLDAFLSVPIDRCFSAARALKTATAEASLASSCNLVTESARAHGNYFVNTQ